MKTVFTIALCFACLSSGIDSGAAIPPESAFRDKEGSAPASGAVFRASEENPVAPKRFERSCQDCAQDAVREVRPATPEAGVLPNSGSRDQSFQRTVTAARGWLAAEPGNRAGFETILNSFAGDIDTVMAELRPKGSAAHAKIVGRLVKGDTFVVPKLLARNEDHPFNYYVPPPIMTRPIRWG